MKKIIFAFLFCTVFMVSYQIKAQNILQAKDLSTVSVDQLSEADIVKIQAQLQSNNLTIDQAEPMLLSKGMSASEFIKLKSKIAANAPKTASEKSSASSSGRKQIAITNSIVKDTLNTLVFGSELFSNPTLNFSPDLQLATPVNYVLGPGDELQISIYGVQQYSANALVTAEGKIAVDYVGQLSVAGMTIEAATQKIKNAIAGVYSTVSSGQSKVSISLAQIRTIKVTIVGAKQPGNYSVSSLASVYNALHVAGGPSKNGSYRNIELIRNNKVYKYIDIYDFLVKGDQSSNVSLKDNDVIRIPAYSTRVTIEGEVKRPGIFELKKGEHFANLVSFASGFSESAYTASVNVVQKTSKEFKVKDIAQSEFKNYLPQSGDVFKVTKILDRFENRIKITGAVFRPDFYSFTEGMQITDLIALAEGLKEDAYTNRARIIRLKEDLTTEIINVDLKAALSGEATANQPLKREDLVTIYSVLDFKEEYKITINGEIQKPGTYNYFEGLSLNDVIIESGGLTGSASKRVEIARMLKAESIDAASDARIKLFNIEITPDNNEQTKDFILEPFDVINVRKLAVYEKPQTVTVSGEVTYQGNYVLALKEEKIYNMIVRAGGLKKTADINGVRIKRLIKEEQIEAIANVAASDSLKDELTNRLKNKLKYATIPINWESIVKNRNSSSNIRLFEGDEIVVSSYNESIKVTGNVLLNSEMPYSKGKSFKYYLDAVGGVDAKGWKRKAYIIYPNGKAAVSKSFLFIRSTPKVLAGSQIVVPEKPEVRKLSTGEFVSIAGVLASLAGVIIAILR
ncbi:SLBB domain-containing protein [Flavobacterium crassostreae]|uniref:Sugar transporter n=1 Tax=Flavobacterium crassostreae TaxID=1763534 RepID=A0A1B9E3P0_9FLAO|nr:SLBB domain-containing protein [Flavobacterium crassostreae]OCB76574.1 sugar transporter [Flavobacterium crassostreae]